MRMAVFGIVMTVGGTVGQGSITITITIRLVHCTARGNGCCGSGSHDWVRSVGDLGVALLGYGLGQLVCTLRKYLR